MKKITLLFLLGIVVNWSQVNAQSLKITVGEAEFIATLNNNETVNAFLELLPMTVNMSDLGGVEKYYYLPQNLPGAATNPGLINAGDLMIYTSNCLVLFYAPQNTSYSYIALGHIDDITGLANVLGTGNVQVTYELNEPTMSLEDVSGKDDFFKVFPNPALDYFEVSGEFEQLTVRDLKGTVIIHSKNRKVDTRAFPNGVYIIAIDSGQETISKKLIISK